MIENNTEVFINCPYDDEYKPYMQVIIFVVLFFRFTPKLSSDTTDSGENRVDKIYNQIAHATYSVHDLSRCQASKSGETYRMNMPFELGMCFALKKILAPTARPILILENQKHSLQKSLSDISGVGTKAHSNDHMKLVRIIKDWLIEFYPSYLDMPEAGSQRIWDFYTEFQAALYANMIDNGHTPDDIDNLPVNRLIAKMQEFIDDL